MVAYLQNLECAADLLALGALGLAMVVLLALCFAALFSRHSDED